MATQKKKVKKTQKTSRLKKIANQPDSVFILKLVLYVVLGTFWLKFSQPFIVGGFMISGVPLGLMMGLFFASRDRFQVDRKIEYAVLFVVTVVSYFVPAGILI